jgi:hypothetical protein
MNETDSPRTSQHLAARPLRSAIASDNSSTTLDTRGQRCRNVIDRGDVYFELLTDAGHVLICQPCTERLIPDLYDEILDRPNPPLT